VGSVLVKVGWACLTRVMSLEAAAALMWRLGWRMELLQSRARANVPTALQHTHTHTHNHHLSRNSWPSQSQKTVMV